MKRFLISQLLFILLALAVLFFLAHYPQKLGVVDDLWPRKVKKIYLAEVD